MFAAIEEYLEQNPDLAAEGRQDATCSRSATEALDARPQERHGQRQAGRRRGASARSSSSEDDFLALTQGKADAMKLFTTGKLKISGNVMASQKLQFL